MMDEVGRSRERWCNGGRLMDGVLGRNQESEFREDLEVTWRELLTQEGQSRRLHAGSLELSNLPQNF